MDKNQTKKIIDGHDQVQIGVGFSGLFTAVTIFFIGFLLPGLSNYDVSIKIPILFLIISTFGFLYSTLIYANASGEIARAHVERFTRSIRLGNAISEYIGVYFLLLSIPLVLRAITQDSFLIISTLVVDLAGLLAYHLGGFSIMERNYKRFHYLFLSVILTLEVIIFFVQRQNLFYFSLLSTILIVFLILLTIFAKKEEY